MTPHSNRLDPYQAVTELILAHLERGTVPWRRPWQQTVGRPCNFHSGRLYQGVNVLLLGLCRFASPYWMTFRQVQARGGSVRKGEHGALVVKYGSFEKPLHDDQGRETEEKQKKSYLKAYKVFNAVQIDGIEFPTPKIGAVASADASLGSAEQVVSGMPQPPAIREGERTRASYNRVTDTVTLPSRDAFTSLEEFYLTLFHELVHATGHESRLQRQSLLSHDGFGGKVYSQEELVAEMGAAFLGTEASIVRDEHEQSAAYLQGWLTVLRVKDHRRWIVQAASQAERAAEFVLGRIAQTKAA